MTVRARRMAGMAVSAGILLSLGAGLAAAQGLPVRIHKEIRSFSGNPAQVIATTDAPPARYTLYSAHKEGGRPWADAIWARRDAGGVTYLSRAYDCAAGTFRWLGEAARIDRISLSVRSIDQIRPQPLTPGTLEYLLARHACAL